MNLSDVDASPRQSGPAASMPSSANPIAPGAMSATCDATEVPELTPLTPQYSEADHAIYVSALHSALSNPQIRNIALSGTYGVGKSSILKELVSRNQSKVVELSLSTLAPIEPAKDSGALPPQATTPTNRIQQEIVKQLLYREEPRNTPGSRFQRIERFNWLREIVIAFIFALIASVTFLLTGWGATIAKALPPSVALGGAIHLVLAPAFMAIALTLRKLFHGRLRIKELSAGAATVTLDERSVSYFDQYLDEIVYFFEVSKRNIVVFEDIDRFDDAHIFETLRSLNTLLNASPQIETEIKFIYAIKDSIFDQLGLLLQRNRPQDTQLASDDSALSETVRANRTKFFDLVIPVVPFITHQNARDITTRLLKEIDHEIDQKLIDLASRHVPEMRLLKNVRNEFLIFRHQILRSGSRLKLSQSGLFALMLYKSTHLSDFEAIRLGESKLDLLYSHGRKIVSVNIERLEKELSATHRRQALADGLDTRSADLGERLMKIGQMLMRAASHPVSEGPFELRGVSYPRADYTNPKFWLAFQDASDSEVVIFSWQRDHYNSLHLLSMSKADIIDLLGKYWNPEQWDELDAQAEVELRSSISSDLAELRAADMEQILARTDWSALHGDRMMSLDALARQELKVGLAFHLLRAGYINRNFNLYTSVFHGDRVGPAAMNFLIHNVQRNLMDEHFVLEPGEVDEVIGECTVADFSEPGLYNLSILEHLLASEKQSKQHQDLFGRQLASLLKMGPEQRRFLQAVLSHSSARQAIVERIAPGYNEVLTYLCYEVELEDDVRLHLIGAALSVLSTRTKYAIDAKFAAFFKDNYSSIRALSEESLTDLSATRISWIFLRCDVKASELSVLGRSLQDALIARSLYEITRSNLASVTRGGSVALDSLASSNEASYQYMIENLPRYLDCILSTDFSVDDELRFQQVLLDAAGEGKPDLVAIAGVISRASPGCIVDELPMVPIHVWPALAQHLRFRTTLPNILAYLSEFGEVDQALASSLLQTRMITEVWDVRQSDKDQAVQQILEARQLLPAERRVELIGMLEISEPLSTSEITPERGALFSLLLQAKMIPDTIDTYTALADTDWSTRVEYIRKSRQFSTFMSPQVIGHDLADFLQSPRVRPTLKKAVLSHLASYAPVADDAGIEQLLISAIRSGTPIPLVAIERYAKVPAASPAGIFDLLSPHLPTIGLPLLLSIISSLGGEYAQLSASDKRRPLLRNEPSLLPILATLKDRGFLSQFNQDKKGIRAIKRRV